MLEVNKLTDGDVEIGTVYHQIRKNDHQKFKVVELKPYEVTAIETLPPEKRLHMRFLFKPIANGTELSDEWQLESNIPSPFDWLAMNKVKTAVSENLNKLKTLLETGHVRLQDGRQIRHG